MPKPLPRQVDQRMRNRDLAREDHRARQQVRQFWKYRCRVCGRKTGVVHEDKRRGAGGVVSLQNSFLACDVPNDGVCHGLLGTRHITPVMANGAEVFDAREELVFEMTEDVAAIVFEKRPRPAHIRIVEG